MSQPFNTLIRPTTISTNPRSNTFITSFTAGSLLNISQRWQLLKWKLGLRWQVTPQSDVAILVLDAQDKILEANLFAKALFSSTGKQIVGQALQSIIPHELPQKQEITEFTLGDRGFEAKRSVLHGGRGGVIGSILTIHDITERKNARQLASQLELEQERVRSLKQMMHDASHDLKTPITVLRTTAHLLEMLANRAQKQSDQLKAAAPEDNPPVQIVLANIEQTVRTMHERSARLEDNVVHLNNVLENLLDSIFFDKPGTLDLVLGDFNAMIAEAVHFQSSMAEEKNLTIVFEGDENLPLVRFDLTSFRRVLQNLLENAVAYTASSGQVTIKSYSREEQAVLEVRDTGIGISAEDLPHIFERSFRTDKARSARASGSGLGLAITQQIVSAHYGKIEVESQIGVGSTFRILLPL